MMRAAHDRAARPSNCLSMLCKGTIMLPLFRLLAASLLLPVAGAVAQQLPYPQSVSASANTVQVTAPVRARWVRPDDARQIGGDYEMANGWFLRVRTTPQYIDVTIDDQKPIRLTSIARNKFVSGDGNVHMVFAQGMSHDEMTMRYRPNPALAQVIVLSSRVAQR
jgi:hypothetical protein